MPFPDPGATATKWSQNASAAAGTWAQAVQQTTKDPTALAAAQAQKMLAGVQAAVTSGFWQRRLADVGISGWKAAVQAKQANYGVGVSAAQSRYQAGIAAFWNYMGPTLSQIEANPPQNLQQAIANMTLWVQTAAAYQRP
jgi:hypothetical protein